ncbi:hypothetical protein LIER_40657 [Lithospermum erythrorhizon]|uniref:Uncharacterized protein n=1 Tax=Lithospermum erythrorhizon TaxID=34254 RepID=A0AAV3QZ01_LITER
MNLAILACQGWRILTRQASLLYKGVQWRVGDGKSIGIWKDPWVPRDTDFHVRRDREDGPRFVAELIRGNEWDKEAVARVLGRMICIRLWPFHLVDIILETW